jgi:hypothetical protein
VPQVGFWKGQHEKSMAIIILTHRKDDETKVRGLARDIATINKQELVLVEKQEVTTWLI